MMEEFYLDTTQTNMNAAEIIRSIMNAQFNTKELQAIFCAAYFALGVNAMPEIAKPDIPVYARVPSVLRRERQ